MRAHGLLKGAFGVAGMAALSACVAPPVDAVADRIEETDLGAALSVRDGVIIAANGGARSDLPEDEGAILDLPEALGAAQDGAAAEDVSESDEAPPMATPLQNNVPLTNLNGFLGEEHYFTLDVPAGATDLVFQTSGGTGYLILDVQLGWPSSGQPCVPTGTETSYTCAVSSVQAGTYYVMMVAFFPSYSGVTLKGSFTPPVATTADLVINEIDYDNVGTDSSEYVEIYNPAGGAVSLAGCALVLVNGADVSTYSTVDLSSAGSLGAGQYLVVGGSAVAVPAGAKKINFSASMNSIQNDKDGVALVCGASVIDKLSYEGSITAASIPDVGTVSLVEGTAFTGADSNTATRALCRLPNGSDTDNASVDWSTCSVLTPGAAN